MINIVSVHTPTKRGRCTAALALGGALFFASSTSLAGDPKPEGAVEEDAAAYCQWVDGQSGSAAAPLIAPSVFVSSGITNGLEGNPGSTTLPPTGRLTAGMSYSVSGLLRGMATNQRGDADCARYRILSGLQAFVETYRDGESRRALGAKLAVLEGALPRAEEIQARTKNALRENRATVEELTGAQLRLDELRVQIARARSDHDALQRRAAPNFKNVSEALKRHADAEAEVERQDAKIRKSAAWDLTLRGGYDRVFGVRDHVPFFAMATLTVNLGLLAQPSHDNRAVEGRRRWASVAVEGPNDRVVQAVTKLRAMRAETKTRLVGHAQLVSDLEQRARSLEALGRDATRALADNTWFELVKAKADQAYFEVLAAELDGIFASGDG